MIPDPSHSALRSLQTRDSRATHLDVEGHQRVVQQQHPRRHQLARAGSGRRRALAARGPRGRGRRRRRRGRLSAQRHVSSPAAASGYRSTPETRTDRLGRRTVTIGHRAAPALTSHTAQSPRPSPGVALSPTVTGATRSGATCRGEDTGQSRKQGGRKEVPLGAQHSTTTAVSVYRRR